MVLEKRLLYGHGSEIEMDMIRIDKDRSQEMKIEMEEENGKWKMKTKDGKMENLQAMLYYSVYTLWIWMSESMQKLTKIIFIGDGAMWIGDNARWLNDR